MNAKHFSWEKRRSKIVSIFHLKDWIISENRADTSKKRCEGVNQDKSQRVVQRSKLRCIVCRVDERDKKAKSGVTTSSVPPDWEIEISSEKQRSRLIHKVGTLWKWVKSVFEEWRWQCSWFPLNVPRIE